MTSGPNFPVFNFDPNWSAFVTETLSWMTDVLTSKTGTEQVRSLLLTPRKQVEYQGLYSGQDRASLDNALTGIGVHDWMLPTWWDQHSAADDIALGSSFIPCDTSSISLIHEGGLILLRGGRRVYEVVEVESLVDDGIILKTPTTLPWAMNSVRIYALQRVRFDQQPQQMRASDGTVSASFKFIVTEPDYFAAMKFVLSSGTSLITNNLVSRRFSKSSDVSIYDPNSGITVGQAAMARAMFTAASGLAKSKGFDSLSASDRYQQFGQGLLDGIVDGGQSNYAILRQPIPVQPGQFAIPHWLYAARGSVRDFAETSQGYELFPTPKRLRAYFASADTAAYRDLFLALSYGQTTDTRGGDMQTRWRMVNDAFLQTQMQNRKLDDGREIFGLWKGLMPVLPQGAEPTGLACSTNHASGTPPNVLGVNSSNMGYNFLTRNSLGQIIFDVPDSFDVTQDTVTQPSSNPPTNNGQPPNTQQVNAVVTVLRDVNYYRHMRDDWRASKSYQSADGYLMIDFVLDRSFTSEESVKIGIMYQDKVWIAILNNGEITNGSKHYLDIGRFVDNGNSPISHGQPIDTYFISVTAKTAYRATLGRMRMVVSQTQEADVQPYFPGTNSFRISGYNNISLPVGYRGSPWIGGQTVDFWPMMAIAKPNMFSDINASKLPTYDFSNNRPIYAFSDFTSAGVRKSPEALLAEQGINFLLLAQAKYAGDSNGVLGPMAHTFVMNRPESVEFGNAPAFSWLYWNNRTERDVFWQLRAIEGLANFCRLSISTGKQMVFNDVKLTHKNKFVYKGGTEEEGAIIPLDKTDQWRDTYPTARYVVLSFLMWFDQNWKMYGGVSFNDLPVTYNGVKVTAFDITKLSGFGDVLSWVDDPRVTTSLHEKGQVYSVAMVLRTCFCMKQVDLVNLEFYDNLITKSWNYLERYWQNSGEMGATWCSSAEAMDWRHAEIITALGEMLKVRSAIPKAVPVADVELRLVSAIEWLERYGSQSGEIIPGMNVIYQGRPVLTRSPDEKGNMAVDVQRLTEDFDNGISIPLQSEYTPEVYNRPQHTWWIRGRRDHYDFRKMLYALRGRALPFWKPTFFRDVMLVKDIKAGDTTLTVANTGYTAAGGPRRTREQIIFFLRDGTYIFRQIVNSNVVNTDVEILNIGSPIRLNIAEADIHRISFMDLVRMDQDGFQFGHITDSDGVSTSTTVMKSIKVV